MKRWIALLLALLQCSLLLACGQAQPEQPSQFSAGFSKIDMTPKESVPLDGYSGANDAQYRRSDFTEKPLYATCTAITDEKGKTVLLITLDLLNAAIADTMRKAISDKTDIPVEQIILHCTHTHSSVAVSVPEPAVMEYLSLLTQQLVTVSREALQDRKPIISLETGFTRTEYCNTVRHYLLTNGEYIAYTGAKLPSGATWYGYTSAADDLLQVVKFSREGGKDILFVNWQAHPCAAVDKKTVTSDYPGVLREALEESLDCHAVYIQGGAGNLMTGTELAADVLKYDRNYHQLGQLLADNAIDAISKGQTTELTELHIQQSELELTTKYGDNRTVTLCGFSIGDFAMITAPFEIFDTNAMAVKEASPYRMTFYASCCGGSNGYLPTPESFDWVQAYEAQITQFPKGTAETVQAAQSQLLQDLFESTGRVEAEKPEGYVRPPYEPKTDGVLYYTCVRSTEDFQPVKNGFYTFETMDEKGNKPLLLIKDLQVAEKILSVESAQYLFDQQNVVVGILE